jgi:hypothetical protein
MKPITDQDVSVTRPGEVCTEASDLDLQAWPRMIPTTMGNQQAFAFHRFEPHGEEAQAMAIYRQPDTGLVLRIFND